MKLGVIGTGYVGLVSGVCLAAKGHDVTCVDRDASIVERLNRGEPHIHERGLPALLAQVIEAGRFRATTDTASVLDEVDTVLIAVGTPSEDGVIDLTHVRAVAREIGAYLRNSTRAIAVIVNSTVVPGTTDTVVRGEIEHASGKTFPAFGLGMNPEFLREGEAIEDFMFPDRIVLGHEDEMTLARLEALYQPWDVAKVRVNTRTAEMIKYANNALLALQISGINEIANLSAAVGGIDVMDVVQGVHLDKRWNPIIEGSRRVEPQILTYLVPGCGFGGSCFPKDVQALRSQGQAKGLPMHMLNGILDVNDRQPFQVASIIERHKNLAGAKVLVLGLAFKPDTDDVRESASLKIVSDLLHKGAVVSAHDPIATENFKRFLGEESRRIFFRDDWRSAVTENDIIVVATRWEVYRQLPELPLDGKFVFDARRMFAAHSLKGARYLSIGLG
ncbi:MAG: UDP-glucose/GDP-mannose dehydrogenase family protein [Nevskiaceae bacterium]|nr:UDP-glucose/GDP-mannose dehydrogenase family protein [Nevskiaceae bacterium]